MWLSYWVKYDKFVLETNKQTKKTVKDSLRKRWHPVNLPTCEKGVPTQFSVYREEHKLVASGSFVSQMGKINFMKRFERNFIVEKSLKARKHADGRPINSRRPRNDYYEGFV